MDTKRTQDLLDRIYAVVDKNVDNPTPLSRIHELVARAIAEPMVITPSEVQELARALTVYFPMAEKRSSNVRSGLELT